MTWLVLPPLCICCRALTTEPRAVLSPFAEAAVFLAGTDERGFTHSHNRTTAGCRGPIRSVAFGIADGSLRCVERRALTSLKVRPTRSPCLNIARQGTGVGINDARGSGVLASPSTVFPCPKGESL
jgi:hypothetical protein